MRIARDCEDGNFEEFSFLKMHHGIDSLRVEEIIIEEFRLPTYTAARELYSKWLAAQSTTRSDNS
jgi:hypothetical protein